MKRELPDEIIDLILTYVNIRCHICRQRITCYNYNNFFAYPNNSITYCSWMCFNYT